MADCKASGHAAPIDSVEPSGGLHCIVVGHENISYRGTSVVANDATLWMLRHWLLIACSAITAGTDQEADDVAALRRYFEEWDWICPGVIVGVDLDPVLPASHPQRLELYLQLIQAAAEMIGAYGDAIPYAYLEQHFNSDPACGVFPADSPTEPLLRTLATLGVQVKAGREV